LTLSADSANPFEIMARKCELLGKKNLYGNTVSNANNKNRTRSLVNLSWKRFWVAELKQFVRVRVSNRALRIIDKVGGLIPACRKNQKTLSPELEKVLKKASS
jgi:large subunit ribosomal protein L28